MERAFNQQFYLIIIEITRLFLSWHQNASCLRFYSDRNEMKKMIIYILILCYVLCDIFSCYCFIVSFFKWKSRSVRAIFNYDNDQTVHLCILEIACSVQGQCFSFYFNNMIESTYSMLFLFTFVILICLYLWDNGIRMLIRALTGLCILKKHMSSLKQESAEYRFCHKAMTLFWIYSLNAVPWWVYETPH